MKSTDKSQITENPWAEGMKGSHDASWLGRLWQGFVGTLVAATQVANAHGEDQDAEENRSYRPSCHDPYMDPGNALYDEEFHKNDW